MEPTRTNAVRTLDKAPRSVPKPPDPGEAAERGRTIIDDEVVSVIGRIAAERVEGIHKLGDSTLRGMIGRLGRSGGVDAEVGMKEAALDIEVVVEFGYSIRDVARALRAEIIETIETMTGRNVIEVNVYVADVHVPDAAFRRRRNVE